MSTSRRDLGGSAVQARVKLQRAVTAIAVLLLAVMAITGSPRDSAAQEEVAVHLMTVVSARDDVVIGVTETEIPALAARSPVGVVADLLAGQGRLSAWRYAPARGEDGVIRLMPIHRMAIFAGGVIRIEPYVPDQEVVPPSE